MNRIKPPRHIVWSVDTVDMDDPFQRRWYIQQVLTHGRMEDVKTLDFDEVERELPNMRLPTHVRDLWEGHFERQKRG